MLTLSQPAATLLTDARSQQGIPDDALLRVAGATDGEQGISLGFVDTPMEGDHTASVHGLAYCVAPEVADALDAAKIDPRRVVVWIRNPAVLDASRSGELFGDGGWCLAAVLGADGRAAAWVTGDRVGVEDAAFAFSEAETVKKVESANV